MQIHSPDNPADQTGWENEAQLYRPDNPADQTGWENKTQFPCAFCGRPISPDQFDQLGQCYECGRLRQTETRMCFESIFEGVFDDYGYVGRSE